MTNPRQSRNLTFNLSLGAARFALAITFLLIVVATQSAQAQSFNVPHTFTAGEDGASPKVGVRLDRGGNIYGTAAHGGGTDSRSLAQIGDIHVDYPYCLGTGNCYWDIGIYGSPASGSANFTPVGTPATFNFVTGEATSWSLHGSIYMATFGYGGFFDMTYSGGLTFTGVVTAGSVDGNGGGSSVYVEFFGQWSNGQYATGDSREYQQTSYTDASLDVYEAPIPKYTVLHNFTGGQDGGNPSAGVTLDGAGNLYGTTYAGGTGNGTVYKLKRSGSNWVFDPLYSFAGGSDGANPEARAIFGPNGTLYGTTFLEEIAIAMKAAARSSISSLPHRLQNRTLPLGGYSALWFHGH